jgi:hypothetical protein
MVSFAKRLQGRLQRHNPAGPEIPVLLPQVAPADEVPVEGVKSQPDWFHLAFADFFLRIPVGYFQDIPVDNRALNDGQIIGIRQ